MSHIVKSIFSVFFFCLVLPACHPPAGETREGNATKPNILLIYADDVGIGDISAYGSGKIRTPNIDELASNGIRFTNAYATSAMCTPSRFSLLTGVYAFRLAGAGILSAEDPLLIDRNSPTLPGILQDNGYRTGIVGKWHLGLGDSTGVDWNGEIRPGPLEVGFGSSFLLPVTNDRVPTVYVDGHRVLNLDAERDPIFVRYPAEGHHEYQEKQFGKDRRKAFQPLVGDLPTGLTHPELLRYKADDQHAGTIVSGVSRIGHMAGGRSAWWDDETMSSVFMEKTEDFIKNASSQPFFLMLSMNQNHVARIPDKRFVGKSGTGLRGDCVLELDWVVGEVVRVLKEQGEFDNTMIIFTSDNGPVFFDGYEDGSLTDHNDHDPSGPFRGGKYIAYEGGTRMPTIAHWPGGIEGGKVSDVLFSQVDLLATLTELAGAQLPKDSYFDSRNVLSAFLGKNDEGNPYVIQQSSDGLGLRSGKWKYIEPSKRSAWGYNRHNLGEENRMHVDMLGPGEYLFDLSEDPQEKVNLAETFPEKLAELREILESEKRRKLQ